MGFQIIFGDGEVDGKAGLTNSTLIGTIVFMNTITIPASQARADFYDLLEEASRGLRKIAITLRGKVKAVLMSPDEVEGWEETMEIMSDPKAYQELKQSIAQMERGELISHEDLMKELGLRDK